VDEFTKVLLSNRLEQMIARETELTSSIEKKDKEISALTAMVETYTKNPGFGDAGTALEVSVFLILKKTGRKDSFNLLDFFIPSNTCLIIFFFFSYIQELMDLEFSMELLRGEHLRITSQMNILKNAGGNDIFATKIRNNFFPL